MSVYYYKLTEEEKERYLAQSGVRYERAVAENRNGKNDDEFTAEERKEMLEVVEFVEGCSDFQLLRLLNMLAPAMGASSQRLHAAMLPRVLTQKKKAVAAATLREHIRMILAVESMSKHARTLMAENLFRGPYKERDEYYKVKIAREAALQKRASNPAEYAEIVVRIIYNSLTGFFRGSKLSSSFLHRKNSPFYPKNNTGKPEIDFLLEQAKRYMLDGQKTTEKCDKESSGISPEFEVEAKTMLKEKMMQDILGEKA